MKKAISLTAAIAFATIATPASAQIAGGLGGVGGLGGTLDSTLGGINSTIRSSTGGAIDARGATRGSTRIDRREGRVETSREGDAAVTGSANQLLAAPLGEAGADAQGSGNASANGSASAQLIGTDAVRGTVGTARDSVTGVAAGVQGTASAMVAGAASSATGAVSGAGSIAGSGSANGNSSGSAAGNGLADSAGSILTAEGNGTANGTGTFNVVQDMDVLSSEGAKIGTVREVIADGNGQVSHLLVSNGDARELVPAGDFTAAGDALVMGSGEVSGLANTPSEGVGAETAQ